MKTPGGLPADADAFLVFEAADLAWRWGFDLLGYRLQPQLDRFRRYYNTVRPHRALGRATPAQAYAARPKAVPTGPVIPLLTEVVDSLGLPIRGNHCD